MRRGGGTRTTHTHAAEREREREREITEEEEEDDDVSIKGCTHGPVVAKKTSKPILGDPQKEAHARRYLPVGGLFFIDSVLLAVCYRDSDRVWDGRPAATP